MGTFSSKGTGEGIEAGQRKWEGSLVGLHQTDRGRSLLLGPGCILKLRCRAGRELYCRLLGSVCRTADGIVSPVAVLW